MIMVFLLPGFPSRGPLVFLLCCANFFEAKEMLVQGLDAQLAQFTKDQETVPVCGSHQEFV